MLKILRQSILFRHQIVSKNLRRTFLSEAYHCKEIWANRLSSPLLQKVNLDLLYHELEQKFQKTRGISAVDVDIFANSVKDELFIDELLDLVYKLRLSSDTGNALNSTTHAVIRTLLDHNKVRDLLLVLNDRLNYGLFLDNYTANILMDVFWKNKNYTAGAFIASQIMLQEDFTHPLNTSFSLLHCYNYLLKPGEWPQSPEPEEPEEEVKVRVKYLRNPCFDDHFDLKEPQKIVGKTLVAAAKGEDSLSLSLKIAGLALWGKEELLEDCLKKTNTKLFKDVCQVVPDDNNLKAKLVEVFTEPGDVNALLETLVKQDVAKVSEKDIADQCKLYEQWENERLKALEEQKRKLLIIQRLQEIKKLQASLQEKEQKLWFFEKEEDIELAIEDHNEELAKKTVIKTKETSKKDDENYVPPEVGIKRN